MINWKRFSKDWEQAILSMFPNVEIKVENFGNEMIVILLKGPFSSPTKYFPFGKFYEDLDEQLSPEMYYFWMKVDQLREQIKVRPIFALPELMEKSKNNYSWRYSIGSDETPYRNIFEIQEKIDDSQEDLGELSEDEEEVADNPRVSSLKMAAKTLKLLSKKILAAPIREIRNDRDFDQNLEEAKKSGEMVSLKYTRADGFTYNIKVVILDFFQIRGKDYLWVEKDGVKNNFRSLKKDKVN